uniref:Uncharacterized protein n=1 Tax=Rhizophora mucronata TaxID=61149 RepID=A0A2P2PYK8_RHIMU
MGLQKKVENKSITKRVDMQHVYQLKKS